MKRKQRLWLAPALVPLSLLLLGAGCAERDRDQGIIEDETRFEQGGQTYDQDNETDRTRAEAIYEIRVRDLQNDINNLKQDIQREGYELRGEWQKLEQEANEDLADLRRQVDELSDKAGDEWTDLRANINSELRDLQRRYDEARDQWNQVKDQK